MGNTLRRSRGNNSNHTAQEEIKPVTPNFSKKIQSLAPKNVITNSKEGFECPICFLNFKEVNYATCCKGMICTDCYITLSESCHPKKNHTICPFCNGEDFDVTYVASITSSINVDQVEDANNFSTVDNKDESQVSSSSSSSSSVSTAINQETQLYLHKSSIKDRMALEEAIKTQRSNSVDEPPPFTPSHSHSRASINFPTSSSSNRRTPPSSSRGFSSRGSSSSSTSSRSSRRNPPPVPIQPAHLPTQTNESFSRDIRELINPVTRLHEILASDHSSVQDLEEMMFMEAIRQSLLITPSDNNTENRTNESSNPTNIINENILVENSTTTTTTTTTTTLPRPPDVTESARDLTEPPPQAANDLLHDHGEALVTRDETNNGDDTLDHKNDLEISSVPSQNLIEEQSAEDIQNNVSNITEINEITSDTISLLDQIELALNSSPESTDISPGSDS